MKPRCTLIGAGLVLLMLVPSLRADAARHAAILKEREAVLSRIVAGIESRYAVGAADEEALFAAQLALYSFRRDTAQTNREKAQHQEQIVALQEKRLNAIKARSQAGTKDSLEVLRAKEAVLSAQQTLEEIQSNERKE